MILKVNGTGTNKNNIDTNSYDATTNDNNIDRLCYVP